MIYEIVRLIIPDMLVPKYTASWEKGLDEIASGKRTKDEYNKELNMYISNVVNKIKEEDLTKDIIDRIKPFSSAGLSIEMINKDNSKKSTEKVVGKCPECGKNLLLRKGKYSMFISCNGFPKCKYKQNVK